MTEQHRSDGRRDPWSPSTARTLRHALWVALAGHVLVLLAAATDSLRSSVIIAAAIACSIIAVVTLTDLGPSDGRVRRVVGGLIVGHGVAAAMMLAGVAPVLPTAISLAGLAAAAMLDIASLAAVRRAANEPRDVRPLRLAQRVAVVALVVPALVQPWLASATGVSMRLQAAIFIALAALGVALLACMSIIALRARGRWAVAGLAAWTLGWVAMSADLSSLIVWALGGTAPMGPHQLRELDAGLIQILATAGGLVIGSGIASSFRDVRTRHSAIVLLVGYAIFGLLVAGTEHRIGLVTDFPGLIALRKDRALADAIRSFTLAGLMWQYWRQVAGFVPSRARSSAAR